MKKKAQSQERESMIFVSEIMPKHILNKCFRSQRLGKQGLRVILKSVGFTDERISKKYE